MLRQWFTQVNDDPDKSRYSILRLGRECDVASYHLYYLRANLLVGADSIEAPNDMQAVRLARKRAVGQAVEVWNAHSRIRLVTPALASV